ncbi:hypothetical protein O4215_10875 [Rhodococcus maanshanensis]|uniref:trypsin-like serine protease n=1 Tax=Rhodococcus maanshanensis TaxID=183556 RepID=UPI0022B455B2|nr:trypsin-like serine protease [Rhodococcus maanshanensis]MCZ4556079.1 hypothetical protein [Rhodococcus maanshanensis]
MKRTRLLAGVLSTLALTVGLTATTAGTAAAFGTNDNPRLYNFDKPYDPGPVPIANPGLFIDFTGDLTPHPTTANTFKYMGTYCTLGAVGTDAAGRKIGITAGHCNEPRWIPDPDNPGQLKAPGANLDATTREPCDPQTSATCIRYPDYPKYSGAQADVPITNNDHPVFDMNAVAWAKKYNLPPVNPIGWIRWVDKKGDADDLTATTDYMVIEFAPEVQLSSQVRNKDGGPVFQGGGGLFKVNSIYSGAGGAPALPPISGWLFPATWIENYGARSDRTPITQSAAVNPGAIGYVTNGMIRTLAGNQNGDSGGPVVMKGTGKWVGITAGAVGFSLDYPFYTTSAKNILDHLNAQPAGTAGKGFTVTNN